MLAGFSEEEPGEAMDKCRETSSPTGSGGRFTDIKCRVVIHFTWLSTGWTFTKLATLFDILRADIQRTVNCVMSGTTESLKLVYLPQHRDDIGSTSRSKNLKFTIGVVDATLIQIQKPSEKELG